jgi:hypothetical protein
MAMARNWLTGALLGLSLFAPAALAQVNDKVVVTASYINNDDDDYGREAPYVSIAIPADFVLFSVSLYTTTRSPDERERELERTYADLLAKVKATKGLELELGDPGNSAAADTIVPDEVISTGQDSSIMKLVLKFDVAQKETFPSVRARAEKFIKDIPCTGRTQASTGGEQFIGVNDAKKHREDLLRKIADDTRLLQSIFSSGSNSPAISLTGLGGRVKTRPVGPLELEMYSPYAVTLGSPQPQR